MKPGIYKDMSFSDYKAIDALNPSTVLNMRTSAKEFEYARSHPKPETAGMRLGSLMHMAILEPDKFVSEVAVWDGIRKGRDYNNFLDEKEGRTILTRSEFDACLDVCGAVHNHPE